MVTLNNCLQQKRRQAGLTQQDLADRVGVTQQTIISIERKFYNLSTLLSIQISQELHCQVEEIFFGRNAVMHNNEKSADIPLWILPGLGFGLLPDDATIQSTRHPRANHGDDVDHHWHERLSLAPYTGTARRARIYLQLFALRRSLIVTCLAWLPVALLLSSSLATTWALMTVIWTVHIIMWYVLSRRLPGLTGDDL